MSWTPPTPVQGQPHQFVSKAQQERQLRLQQRQEQERLEQQKKAIVWIERGYTCWKQRQEAQVKYQQQWDAMISYWPRQPCFMMILLSNYVRVSTTRDHRCALLCEALLCIPVQAWRDFIKTRRQEIKIQEWIQVCLASVCRVKSIHNGESSYFMGPELRLLLLWLDPSFWKDFSVNLQLTSRDYIRIHQGLYEKSSLLQHKQDQRKSMLWINALLRSVSLLFAPTLHLSLNTNQAVLYCTHILSVPSLVHYLDDQGIDILAQSTLLSALQESCSLFIQEWKLHQSPEAMLFILANCIDLMHRMKSRQLQTPNLIDWMVVVLNILEHMGLEIEKTKSSTSVAFHPILNWHRHNQHGYGSFNTDLMFECVKHQVESIWSKSWIEELFSCLDDPGSVDNLLPVAYLCQTCRVYALVGKILPKVSDSMLYSLAYWPEFVKRLWYFMKRLQHTKPTGLGLFLKAVSSQKEMDQEHLTSVLYVFCETTKFLFLTLDDDEVYEQGKPMDLNEMSELCEFLNEFCFLWYWNGLESDKMSVLVSAKRLLSLLLDRHGRKPFSTRLDLTRKQVSKKNFSDIFIKNQGSVEEKERAWRIVSHMPHCVPFTLRVDIFRQLVLQDKQAIGYETIGAHITVRRLRLFEDGFDLLCKLPIDRLRQTIKVSFRNELGQVEAGIDRYGLFKEFLSNMCQFIFQPHLNLFISTPTQEGNVVPSSTAFQTTQADGYNATELYEFCGKMIGKALYEGITLDIPYASFVYAKMMGRYCYLDELPGLDPVLYKSLTFIKKYDGDCEDLGLSFSMDQNVFGQVKTIELKPGGRKMAVNHTNKFEYIYLMADYRLNIECRDAYRALIKGFKSMISDKWINLFLPNEMQKLVCGECLDFNPKELKQFTRYEGGYFEHHPTIRKFWSVLEAMSVEEKRLFLKFVTSCSKPPVGGFQFLNPPFCIRYVEEEREQQGSSLSEWMKGVLLLGKDKSRLPTASTCFNLLKLPAYKNKSILREKLVYAASSILLYSYVDQLCQWF